MQVAFRVLVVGSLVFGELLPRLFRDINILHELDDRLSLGFGPAGIVCALSELIRDFLIAHGVGRAPFAEVCPSTDGASILQVNLDDRGHLVVSSRPRD